MSTLSILRHTLKLNAAVITTQQLDLMMLKQEAKDHKKVGDVGFFIDACADMRKLKRKLAKSHEMQQRVLEEVATLFRIERVQHKYLTVFGKLPTTNVATTHEQEAMLDSLLLEMKHKAEAKLSASNNVVH